MAPSIERGRALKASSPTPRECSVHGGKGLAVSLQSMEPRCVQKPLPSAEVFRGDATGLDPSRPWPTIGTASINMLVRERKAYWAAAAVTEAVLPTSTMKPTAHHALAGLTMMTGTRRGSGFWASQATRAVRTATKRPSTAMAVRRSSGVRGHNRAAHVWAEEAPQLSGTTASTALATPNTA